MVFGGVIVFIVVATISAGHYIWKWLDDYQSGTLDTASPSR